MKDKKILLAVLLYMCVILAGCSEQKSEETKHTTTSTVAVESDSLESNEKKDNMEQDNEEKGNTNEDNTNEENGNESIDNLESDLSDGNEIQSDVLGNKIETDKTKEQTNPNSSDNYTDSKKTESQTNSKPSDIQKDNFSENNNVSNDSTDDKWVTVTGEVIASGIGKDTMMIFGKTYRKFSDGTYYCDNGDWARTKGPVAENLDEFYAIMEEAVKTGNNNFTMHINVFDKSFGRGVEDKFELIENKGTTYYARDRILSSTIEMADFMRISQKTGKNVYWDLNYYYYIETECKYAPVEVSIRYTTLKIYEFSDREGLDKAVDRAYKDGVKNALFILKFDQKDEVFSWKEWCDTYSAGPYMDNSCDSYRKYSYFYNKRIIVAEGPETGAFALSKQPTYETLATWNSLNGIYNCMNELMDDGRIEKRDYSCCYMIEVEIVNWHDEIEKLNIPFCNNNDEMMTQVKKFTGERNDQLGYVGYAKCEYEEAYDYYLNAMEYVPGNRIYYYLIANGYWLLVKEH